jgi:hypothetical protein
LKEVQAGLLRCRVALGLIATLLLFIVVTLPFSVADVLSDIAGSPYGGRFPLPAGSEVPPAPTHTRLNLALVALDETQQLVTVRVSGHYSHVHLLALERPTCLRALAVVLTLLVSAAAAYAVFLRPLQELVVNSGALVLGVWGIRQILVPGSYNFVTSVDLSLSLVILFLLGAITVRAPLRARARRPPLPPRRPRAGPGDRGVARGITRNVPPPFERRRAARGAAPGAAASRAGRTTPPARARPTPGAGTDRRSSWPPATTA